jgi:aldehyde:ferredoxin oxidoreductase
MGNHDAMARATVMIQDRQYAHDCLVVCGFLWPITDSQFTPDHLGDLSLESSILSAVTGKDIDEEGLNRVGETVFNLDRAILVREGHRGVEDDRVPEAWHNIPLKIDMTNPEMILPGKGDEIVCQKGKVVDRDEFARTRRLYYEMRHWDEHTGLQTTAQLRDLGLDDVASDLKRRGLAR